MGAAKTKEERYLYNAAIEDTNNRLKESKPKPHQGHTFTIEALVFFVGDLIFLNKLHELVLLFIFHV